MKCFVGVGSNPILSTKKERNEMPTYRQEYECDDCGVESHVFIEEGVTILDFLSRIAVSAKNAGSDHEVV